MKDTLIKQKLTNQLTGLATASLLAVSPAVFAAGGSASTSHTGAGDQQQNAATSQSSGMDQQRVSGTENSDWQREQDGQELGADSNETANEGLAGTNDQPRSGSTEEQFSAVGSSSDLNQTTEQRSANSDLNSPRSNEDQGIAGTDSREFDRQQNRNAGMGSESNQNMQSDQALSAASPDELQDRQVINQNGEDLGDVQEVITDADGSISGVVVSVGGILGMGATDLYASADDLELEQDQLVWQTDLDEDALAERQEYEAASATP